MSYGGIEFENLGETGGDWNSFVEGAKKYWLHVYAAVMTLLFIVFIVLWDKERSKTAVVPAASTFAALAPRKSKFIDGNVSFYPQTASINERSDRFAPTKPYVHHFVSPAADRMKALHKSQFLSQRQGPEVWVDQADVDYWATEIQNATPATDDSDVSNAAPAAPAASTFVGRPLPNKSSFAAEDKLSKIAHGL